MSRMFMSLTPGAIGIRASLVEGLDLAKAAGFGGLDLPMGEVAGLVESESAAHVKGLFEEAGLRMGGWNLAVAWRAEEAEYKESLAGLPRLAAIGHALGATRLSTWVPPASDDLAFGENFEFHVNRFRPIAEVLAEHGCRLGLEFIGPATSRAKAGHAFIHTMAGMLELCDAIGTGNVGLLLDSWHWYTSGGTLEELGKLTADQVVRVHINDAPKGLPLGAHIDSERALPGATGVIDLAGFLRQLDAIGYAGPVSPEPCKGKPEGVCPLAAARMTAEGLLRVWEAAGLSPTLSRT